MQQLMAARSGATGLNFDLLQGLVIKPEHLSHKTDLGKLSKHVKQGDGNRLFLDTESIKNINVGKSDKGKGESYNISSQLNFATDMKTARLMNTEGGGVFNYATRMLW